MTKAGCNKASLISKSLRRSPSCTFVCKKLSISLDPFKSVLAVMFLKPSKVSPKVSTSFTITLALSLTTMLSSSLFISLTLLDCSSVKAGSLTCFISWDNLFFSKIKLTISGCTVSDKPKGFIWFTALWTSLYLSFIVLASCIVISPLETCESNSAFILTSVPVICVKSNSCLLMSPSKSSTALSTLASFIKAFCFLLLIPVLSILMLLEAPLGPAAEIVPIIVES